LQGAKFLASNHRAKACVTIAHLRHATSGSGGGLRRELECSRAVEQEFDDVTRRRAVPAIERRSKGETLQAE
jgi:hypothetical protein